MNPQLKPDSSLLSSCIGKSIKIKKKEKFGAFSIDSILSTAEADLTLNSLSIDNANAISRKAKRAQRQDPNILTTILNLRLKVL
ncbi:uncharacterized protein Dyak_GE28578, isoform D [Drosophila yakuba]|uniref:Uncharacterized protein, isoform D n=1 Tax=Drosophila yakuba TaxID=7245 RepID=A0A0R1DZQ9_DROYA|nr:uncharacterized protein Dyak_GE28578, isoform D [Drosophila yakuba]